MVAYVWRGGSLPRLGLPSQPPRRLRSASLPAVSEPVLRGVPRRSLAGLTTTTDLYFSRRRRPSRTGGCG
eukprot:236780-Pyramimonas_sp.AAC.1